MWLGASRTSGALRVRKRVTHNPDLGIAARESVTQACRMDFVAVFKPLGLDLLALVWPTACVGCGAPDRDCCATCLAQIRAPSPLRRPDLGVPCFARAQYEGPLRAALIAYKHGGRFGFSGALGLQLRPAIVAALGCATGPSPPILVTAPSRAAQVRARGFRHVDVLVRLALRGQRLPVQRVTALRARRGRRGQVGLSPSERAQNAQLVTVRRSAKAVLHGREIVVVDDVMTTGATLLEVQKALERTGARVVACAVLCAAEHSDGRS